MILLPIPNYSADFLVLLSSVHDAQCTAN